MTLQGHFYTLPPHDPTAGGQHPVVPDMAWVTQTLRAGFLGQIFVVLTFLSTSAYFPPALVDSPPSWSRSTFSFQLPCQLCTSQDPDVLSGTSLLLDSLASLSPNASSIIVLTHRGEMSFLKRKRMRGLKVLFKLSLKA